MRLKHKKIQHNLFSHHRNPTCFLREWSQCWHHGNMGHDPSYTLSIRRLEFQKVLCLISCLGHWHDVYHIINIYFLSYWFSSTSKPNIFRSNWTLVLSQWKSQTKKKTASTGEMTKGISWNSPTAQPPKEWSVENFQRRSSPPARAIKSSRRSEDGLGRTKRLAEVLFVPCRVSFPQRSKVGTTDALHAEPRIQELYKDVKAQNDWTEGPPSCV